MVRVRLGLGFQLPVDRMGLTQLAQLLVGAAHLVDGRVRVRVGVGVRVSAMLGPSHPRHKVRCIYLSDPSPTLSPSPNPYPNPNPNPNPNPSPHSNPTQARDVLLDPGCHDMRPYATL